MSGPEGDDRQARWKERGLPSESHPVLSIVIVSWNVRSYLERCLNSIYSTPPQGVPLETLVVDNGSQDGSAQMVGERFPQVKLLVSRENLGFTRASNQAIRQATGRYILLLNPDTEVLEGALGAMVACMEANPRLAALGPQLLNPDRTVQSSRRRFPNLATAFLESTPLQGWFPRSRVVQRYYLEDRSDKEEQRVDWAIGACLLVRRGALEEVGLLDEDYFMYSEELDWCFRARRAGWEVGYIPGARVVHYGGRSTEQDLAARHIHSQESRLTFFRKHHGRVPAAVLRIFLLACYASQLAIEVAKWLLGHKRTLRRERISAYSLVLRSGLRARG